MCTERQLLWSAWVFTRHEHATFMNERVTLHCYSVTRGKKHAAECTDQSTLHTEHTPEPKVSYTSCLHSSCQRLPHSLCFSWKSRIMRIIEVSSDLSNAENVETMQEQLEEDVPEKAIHTVWRGVCVTEHILSSRTSALGCKKSRPSCCILQVSASQACISVDSIMCSAIGLL